MGFEFNQWCVIVGIENTYRNNNVDWYDIYDQIPRINRSCNKCGYHHLYSVTRLYHDIGPGIRRMASSSISYSRHDYVHSIGTTQQYTKHDDTRIYAIWFSRRSVMGIHVSQFFASILDHQFAFFIFNHDIQSLSLLPIGCHCCTQHL